MNRLLFLVCALAFAYTAYPADGLPSVGWLDFGISDTERVQALESSLRDQGLVDGRTIQLVRVSAGGETRRLAEGARELVQRKVAVIIAPDPPSLEAARNATRSIPIVARVSNDPVALGLAKSLARPGGNITGVYSVADELVQKRLELLHEALPAVKRVAVLWDPNYEASRRWYRDAQTAANALGFELLSAEASGSSPNFSAALLLARKRGAQAVITIRNPEIVRASQSLGRLATEHGLPSIFDEQSFVSYGGLLSYGTNLPELYRHLASYVAKILQGQRPGDLPMERPTRFELVVNLRSAAELKLKVSDSIRARADRLIE